MTAIAAIIDGDTIHIGADHALSASDGGWQIIRKNPKVFMNGEIGIAYTGSPRLGDILQYSWTPPKWNKNEIILDKFMRTVFIDSIRKIFNEKGNDSIIDVEETFGSRFIVAIDGRIFVIQEDYQVSENSDDYMAEGSGRNVAMGSFFSTNSLKAKERLEIALTAASKYVETVRPPFTVITVKPYGKNGGQ